MFWLEAYVAFSFDKFGDYWGNISVLILKNGHEMLSILKSIWVVFKHAWAPRDTIQYPEQQPKLAPRFRGRIVLTRDPDFKERCVACYLCSGVCPVDCIAIEADEDNSGRRFAKTFRINFSRCIYCGFCEEACPTYSIQLIPDFEMAEYDRKNMVYEKEHLLISGPGKYPGYNFYKYAGVEISGKQKGQGLLDKEPNDIRSLMP
jgi:NADH-quinone oxidoreductase subunit I